MYVVVRPFGIRAFSRQRSDSENVIEIGGIVGCGNRVAVIISIAAGSYRQDAMLFFEFNDDALEEGIFGAFAVRAQAHIDDMQICQLPAFDQIVQIVICIKKVGCRAPARVIEYLDGQNVRVVARSRDAFAIVCNSAGYAADSRPVPDWIRHDPRLCSAGDIHHMSLIDIGTDIGVLVEAACIQDSDRHLFVRCGYIPGREEIRP